MSTVMACFVRADGHEYTRECGSVVEAARFLRDGQDSGTLRPTEIALGRSTVWDGDMEALRDLAES